MSSRGPLACCLCGGSLAPERAGSIAAVGRHICSEMATTPTGLEPSEEEPQLQQVVLKVPLALETIVLYLTSKCIMMLGTAQGKLESPVVSSRKPWENRMK